MYISSLLPAAAIFFAAPVYADVAHPDEGMELFLQKFPELRSCTFEQQTQALLFYQETQKIQEFLAQAEQAIDGSDAQTAKAKIDAATQALNDLSTVLPGQPTSPEEESGAESSMPR